MRQQWRMPSSWEPNLGLWCLGSIHQVAGINHLQVIAYDLVELMEIVVTPASIWCAADEPGRAIIGEDHAIFLQRGEDHPVLDWETGDVHVGLQTHPQPHRWQTGIVASRTCIMASRVEVRTAGTWHGEPQRMVDAAAEDLIVAHQARQNGQACRIGAGPSIGPQRIGMQIPDSAGPSLPASIRLLLGGKQLVEMAIVFIHHQHMLVGSCLDQWIRRDGIRANIGLIGIVKGDAGSGRHATRYLIRNAVGGIRSEIWMQPGVQANSVDHGLRVGGRGQG